MDGISLSPQMSSKMCDASTDAPLSGNGAIGSWWNTKSEELFYDRVFNEESWILHRTWRRHLPEPRRFFLVVLGLFPIIAFVVLVTVFAGLYYELLQEKEGWPTIVSTKYLEPFVLTSFALSLLLVFRTNSAYGRWWEARKSFGIMYNCTRILSRLVVTWIQPEDPLRASTLFRWISILTASACTFLRNDASFLEPFNDIFSQEDLRWIEKQQQPPVACMTIISALVRSSKITPYERSVMEKQLADFDNALGALERLQGQSIPLPYTRHTSRFVMSFLCFLPFAIWPQLRWLTIPAMGLITFLLVGIENIGIQIEQPTSVLPLRVFSERGRATVTASASVACNGYTNL